jgi:acyl dehydratase
LEATGKRRVAARARRRHLQAIIFEDPVMSDTPQPKLFLEDLAIGMKFRAGPIEVTADEIKRFASDYDPQPFHLDEEAAKDTFFGGLAASGWHTAALTMRLLTEGGAPFAGGVIGAGGSIEWPRATRPGDQLSVESEILDITPSRSKPDRAMMTVRSTTTNQRGEPVQILMAKLLAFSSGKG